MTGRRRYQGLAARFFLAQLLVVGASVLAAVVVASLAGPPLFHEHLEQAGAGHDAAQMLHVEQAYRDANFWTLGVALATALICCLALTWHVARRIQSPINALTQAAKAMAGGRYDTRVPAMGAGTEVEELAGSFNTMAARLQRTEDTRRRMLSDLAHELRTPVSVLTVYHEALQDGVSHWDEPTGELMGEQLARLTRLVEDINDVSRAEEGRIELDRSPQGVSGLLHAATEAHKEAYATKGVALTMDADPGLAVDVDRERISLGIKQLGGDPIGEGDTYRRGQQVTVTVSSIESGGIEVKFGEDDAPVTAFVRKSDLSRDRNEQRPERFAVGDRVDAMITAVDKASRRISVSIKALEMKDEQEAIEQFGSSDSGASLGDILGAALKNAGSKE